MRETRNSHLHNKKYMMRVLLILILNLYLGSKHREHPSFRCYTVEAAMEFFGMDDIADTPTKNRPNYAFMTIGEHKRNTFKKPLTSSSMNMYWEIMMKMKVNLGMKEHIQIMLVH